MRVIMHVVFVSDGYMMYSNIGIENKSYNGIIMFIRISNGERNYG